MKQERDKAKKLLSALKHSQSPMVKKIQQVDEQLRPTEEQIKAKVRKKCNRLQQEDYIMIKIITKTWPVICFYFFGRCFKTLTLKN